VAIQGFDHTGISFVFDIGNSFEQKINEFIVEVLNVEHIRFMYWPPLLGSGTVDERTQKHVHASCVVFEIIVS